MQTHTHTHTVYTYTHTMNTYIHRYNTYVHTYIHAYIHTYITYIHTYIYTHTYRPPRTYGHATPTSVSAQPLSRFTGGWDRKKPFIQCAS
jgi:hypothetical protein